MVEKREDVEYIAYLATPLGAFGLATDAFQLDAGAFGCDTGTFGFDAGGHGRFQLQSERG